MLKKFCILICLLLMLCSCGTNNEELNLEEPVKDSSEVGNIYYNVDINDSFKNEIIINLSSDAYDIVQHERDMGYDLVSLEYIALNEEINSVKFGDGVYNKNIDKSSSLIKVNLDYEFNEDEFMDSMYIANCFENYDIVSNNKFFEVKLSGQFYCLHDRDLTINVSSVHDVEESNGTLKNNNTYSWTINETNKDSVDIYYKMMKEISDEEIQRNKSEKIKLAFKLILTLIVLGVFIVLHKKLKK